MTERQFREYLKEWGFTLEELNEIIADNPPVLSMVSGYVAEYALKKEWLLRPGITNLVRPRALDRKTKGDWTFDYKGGPFSVECKSLDVPKVKSISEGEWAGQFQCNASDAREVTFPDGSKLVTNCLLRGAFDLVAVALFPWGNHWRFAFARNEDLPLSTYRGYTEYQRSFLLASSMKITWPLRPPFSPDLFPVLDEVLRKRLGETPA